MDNKKELRINSFKQQFLFGEGISFLMGCSKNYIMYWGFYDIYYSIYLSESVHKLYIYGQHFLSKITYPFFNITIFIVILNKFFMQITPQILLCLFSLFPTIILHIYEALFHVLLKFLSLSYNTHLQFASLLHLLNPLLPNCFLVMMFAQE